ncbi:MAG: DUF1800 domain-containing protein [Gemmatimonadaceae bacterium]|nr:DUF1800 domain-containing protein [Gemmatimonadaceae bacterium]
MDKPLRALNRFGLGARPGERGRVPDAQAWLRSQLDGGPPDLEAPPASTHQAISQALRAFREAGQGDEAKRREARQRLTQIAAADARATLLARIGTDRPFVERLVAFWSNHLCIASGAKVLVVPLAGAYERDAIRPHVLGRFEDMVMASARHPAMLVYLDNFQSIGPGSTGARAGRGNNRRGLNENYARELLELHTLGVDGGYTQQDVQELSKLLTGWTVDGLGGPGMPAQPAMQMPGRGRGGRGRGMAPQRPVAASGDIGFVFRPVLHEPGSKTILGARYSEGVTEGEKAIRALCRHESTARFVATKLVTHFVADEPPPAAVDRLAGVFRKTDGDLRAVSAALIDLPEAWDAGARKFRTPQDWLVAVFRAFNSPEVPDTVAPMLRQLRQPLWSPQSPKGFGDGTSEWADPDSLLNRAELARTFARRLAQARRDPRLLLDVVDVAPGDPLRAVLADTSIQPAERIALAFAGPVFQWR